MYNVVNINIGKSRANCRYVYIIIIIKQKCKFWYLTENNKLMFYIKYKTKKVKIIIYF